MVVIKQICKVRLFGDRWVWAENAGLSNSKQRVWVRPINDTFFTGIPTYNITPVECIEFDKPLLHARRNTI